MKTNHTAPGEFTLSQGSGDGTWSFSIGTAAGPADAEVQLPSDASRHDAGREARSSRRLTKSD